MKNDPEIVRQLREEERQGKLKSLSFNTLEVKNLDEPYMSSSNNTVQVLKKSEKNISGKVDIGNIEEKYLTIFENYAVAITIADENERIVSWNKYAEELFNMNEEELSLLHVKDLYPIEEWRKIRSENIRKKGMKYKLQTKMKRKGDVPFDVEVSLSVLRGSGGKIAGSVGIIRDITDWKKTERKLLDSESRYKTVFENSAVAIMLTDEKEKIISWNKYAEKLLNLNKKDLYMKPVSSLYPSEEWKKIRSENVRQKGMKHRIETKILQKNKKPLDVDISISVLKNYKGEIIGSIGIIKDISERKKIEEKLEYERDLLQSLLDNVPDSIVFKDKNSRFVKVNNAKAQHYDTKVEEMIGKTDFDFLPKKEAEKIHNDEKKIMETGESIINEIEKITDKNGHTHWVSVTKTPRYDNGGNIVGTMGISRDVTILKKAEIKLVDSEKRFRNIFDATSDILLYIDADGNIIDINETALVIYELHKENIIGMPLSKMKEFCSEENIAKHLSAIQVVKDGENVKDYECEIVTKQDKIYKFLFSVDVIKEDEEISGLLFRGRDITQRQRAWEELVKLEEKYRVLAETSADGVLTIDHLGRLTYVNPSFEKICARRKSQILATLLRDYFTDDSVYLFQQILIETRKKNSKIEGIELELVRPDGATVPIEVNIAPLKKQEKFAGLICTVRDITVRKKIEGELKKSERLKTEFMNIAAHELKSPVTPIKGYLDLIISDKDTSDKIKDWAKISLRNSERLLKLVNDILDVSRLDTDTMRFEMVKLDPVIILKEVAEDMKPAIEKKNLEMITYIPNELPHIMGDRYRLSQVLKNLLVNAIKFTDNGSIAIVAKQQDKHIIISVVDSGIGISKDELTKIFSKFYQAYTGDDRKNEGTGLGLFICKEIISKHKGEIWAESEIGKGSTFTIKIPHL